jgi:LuxR family maltose regulon positive regulatory protein
MDDKRQWYRYHHLFADVLRGHAMEEQPGQVTMLHRRASEWYEDNGFRADAIGHALAAQDFQWAARLVELVWPASQRSFGSNTWLGWAQALPDDLVRASPVLSVGYAFSSMYNNHVEAADARLRDAERWLETVADMGGRPAEMVVAAEDEFQSLPARIALGRAFLSQAVGDVEATEKYPKRTLELLPEDQHFERAMPAGILGLAYWAKGDLDAVVPLIGEALDKMRAIGNILIAISGTSVIADIRVTQGRLNQAIAV